MPNSSILFLDQYAGLSGGQKVLLNILRPLCANGYRCTVVLPEKGPLAAKIEELGAKCEYFPIGYYSLGRKNIFEALAYLARLPYLTLALLNLMRKERARLVYANAARTFPWAALACFFSKAELIWHVHSIFDKGVARLFCNFFGRFKCVKKIACVSKAVALPLHGLSSKIEIIYNGVEIPERIGKSRLLRKGYSLEEDEILTGNVGILEEWKNQEDLLRAAYLIRESEGAKMRSFIIGDSLYCGTGKQSYKNKLMRLSQELNLGNNVIFTGFRSDINEVLASLDILVICSKQPDPSPLVSLEAASLGLAIISTRPGGVSEMFEEGKEVLFYSSGNTEELKNILLSLLKNADLRRRLGENARIKVAQKYNLDVFFKKIEGLISSVINENR